MNSHRPTISLLVAGFALAACRSTPTTRPVPADRTVAYSVVPNPATIEVSRTDSFLVTPRTVVYVAADATPEVEAIGTYVANLIASRAGATAQRLTAGVSAPD